MGGINGDISDLFFNYDTDDSAYHKAKTDEERHAARLESAKMFAGSVERAFGVIVAPEDLVKDFFGRL